MNTMALLIVLLTVLFLGLLGIVLFFFKHLESQIQAISQSLHLTTGQIDSRLENSSKVIQAVSHQLGSLSQATERIFEATKNLSTLEEILRPPKARGRMGEILLENILKEILPGESFFAVQYAFKNGCKVDAIIRLKDGMIPIDSKFPLDNFKRLIECKDEKEQEVLRKEFSRNVKRHIDSVQKYITPEEGTLPFALMYIPTENIYYQVMVQGKEEELGSDLFSYAAQKRVFPVSPNSLYPYLMTLSLGLRGLKVEEKARDILKYLDQLSTDIERFNQDFKIIGGHLVEADKKFLEAEKRLYRLGLKLTSLKDGS